MRLVQVDEANAQRRRAYFQLVAADGITPATGEAGGQPQIAVSGTDAWTSTGIGTLTALGNGRYFAVLGLALVATVGQTIETRYKSASTAECPGDTIEVVSFDPYTLDDSAIADDVWTFGQRTLTAGGASGGGSAGGTLISGVSTWLPALEFLKRSDDRTIADVVGDTGLRLYQNTDGTINHTTLALDDNLLAALEAASGQFEASVFVGARYTPDNLQLILATKCNARAFMFDLIGRIARMKVIDRRVDMDPNEVVPAWYKETKEELARIRNGDAIFGFQEQANAGAPKAEFMQKEQWDAVKTTATVAKPLFGKRDKDLRRPR